MKINTDFKLEVGKSYNFNKKNYDEAPLYIRRLLDTEGVVGIFQVLDFISIERHPNADWETLLAKIRNLLGDTNNDISNETYRDIDRSYEEISVSIQKLKRIPIQIKLRKGDEEKRIRLPKLFIDAMDKVQGSITNLLFEREWVGQQPRYGDIEVVGQEVLDEVCAAYDNKRLDVLVESALNPSVEARKNLTRDEVLKLLKDESWEVRYRALDQFDPTLDSLQVLELALDDSKASIRRLALAYLGMLESEEVLPYLYKGLRDRSAIVRRTAGDCISDKGSKKAIPHMNESLRDKNKLVRWRAARYLYEVGDDSSLEVLREAIADSEFEVRMQAKIALERIERGEEASGTIWQQMTRGLNGNK